MQQQCQILWWMCGGHSAAGKTLMETLLTIVWRSLVTYPRMTRWETPPGPTMRCLSTMSGMLMSLRVQVGEWLLQRSCQLMLLHLDIPYAPVASNAIDSAQQVAWGGQPSELQAVNETQELPQVEGNMPTQPAPEALQNQPATGMEPETSQASQPNPWSFNPISLILGMIPSHHSLAEDDVSCLLTHQPRHCWPLSTPRDHHRISILA